MDRRPLNPIRDARVAEALARGDKEGALRAFTGDDKPSKGKGPKTPRHCATCGEPTEGWRNICNTCWNAPLPPTPRDLDGKPCPCESGQLFDACHGSGK